MQRAILFAFAIDSVFMQRIEVLARHRPYPMAIAGAYTILGKVSPDHLVPCATHGLTSAQSRLVSGVPAVVYGLSSILSLRIYSTTDSIKITHSSN